MHQRCRHVARLSQTSTRLHRRAKGRTGVAQYHGQTKKMNLTLKPFSNAHQIQESISFSSTKQPSSNSEQFKDPSTTILQTALELVPQTGWTNATLSRAAEKSGYSSIAHGMFLDGPIELVYYFMDQATDRTVTTLRELETSEAFLKMEIDERLKFGIKTRLEELVPYLSNWPEAMALGAQPPNVHLTMTKLATLSDEIWYSAGDRSTDLSWYTKRAMLTGIYASTELFMLTDTSEKFQATWEFLDARITEAIELGDMPQNLEHMAGMVGIGIQSLFSTATSLVGPVVSHTMGGLAHTFVHQEHHSNPASDLVQAVAEKGKEVMGLSNAPSSHEFDSSMSELEEELQKYGGFPTADTTSKHNN